MTTLCLLALLGFQELRGELEPVRPATAKGCLVVEGGGKPSIDVRKRFLALAGGAACRVVVIPQASALPDSGPIAATRWRDLGAQNVTILDLADLVAAVDLIRHADLIWIGGGDQERLMRRLKGTGLPEAIRARYRDGATVGGSSAGAAVMSRTMISRGGEDFPKPLANFPIFAEGLGLWPEVIVDQHFLKLKRTDRLRRAVEEYPDLIGVGIDESTAVIVRGQTMEVIGNSLVTVIDQRKPSLILPAVEVLKGGGGDGAPPAAPSPAYRLSTLNPGVTFDLDRGMILDSIAEKR